MGLNINWDIVLFSSPVADAIFVCATNSIKYSKMLYILHANIKYYPAKKKNQARFAVYDGGNAPLVVKSKRQLRLENKHLHKLTL